MGKKSKAPAAPDPVQTAAAQTATNKETAYYNALLANMDQYTPYGNMTYQNLGTATDPKFTSTINLSPEQQQLYDTTTASDNALASLGYDQIGRITDSVSTPYSYGGIGNEFSAEDIATQQANAEAAYMARLNPQFSRDEEALRTRLINQGIGQGSQAYQREMDQFNQMKNDARSQAILAGQQYGGTAQQQALQRRNQGIQEYDAQRNAPLNEYIGLTSGTQITNPQFSQGGNEGTSPVDYAGLVNQNYQNQMSNYNAKQASSNNLMGGIFGLGGQLGGSFLGSQAGSTALAGLFSDMRIKKNIELVGEENGFPLYEFEYNDLIPDLPKGRFTGVMSSDVRELMPEAVIVGSDGYDRVNYPLIGVEMREVVNG
jgi:hypothetical protein